jgi:hypothetical protein
MRRARRVGRDRTANEAIGEATKDDPTGEEQRRRYRSRIAAIEERNRLLRQKRNASAS